MQGAPTEFVFERPAKRALRVTVKEAHDLLLESLTTQFGDGIPVPSTVAMRLRTRLESSIGEELMDVGTAKPGFRRRYVALEGEIQVIDPASINTEDDTWNGVGLALESPLVGTSVAFVPAIGQPDGFGRHYDAKARREAVLPWLSVPMDWATFLPPAKTPDGPHTAVLGETWALDVGSLEALLAPAGFLGWRSKPQEDRKKVPASESQVLRAFASGVGGNLQLAFDGQLEGDVTARLETVGVDADNGRFARIEIKFDVSLHGERDRFGSGFQGDGEMDVEMLGGDVTMQLKGTAFLDWGLDLRRPIGGVVNAEEAVTMAVRVRPASGEIVVQTIAMKGVMTSGLTIKDAPMIPAKRTVVPQGK